MKNLGLADTECGFFIRDVIKQPDYLTVELKMRYACMYFPETFIIDNKARSMVKFTFPYEIYPIAFTFEV